AVAGMTQFGFAGNSRYLLLPIAIICVISGVGWISAAKAAQRRGRPWEIAFVAAVAVAVVSVSNWAEGSYRFQSFRITDEAQLTQRLPGVIASIGGPTAIAACGQIFTGPYEVQMLSWFLHRPNADILLEPEKPGTVFRVRGTPFPPRGR